MKAYIFPGQGAQFSGMGLDLYEKSPLAQEYFEKANKILGFSITDIMFEGTAEQLKETKVTQPAIFLHSVILAKVLGDSFQPEMVAGHSLGELSALVANGVLSFEDGLQLVSKRALAMQKACEMQESTMAAVLGLEDAVVEEVCASIDGVVVAANYNCPGQLVISGEIEAVKKACEVLTEKGARRALLLPVGGAFHSPMMEPAREELAAIEQKTYDKTYGDLGSVNMDADMEEDIPITERVEPVKPKTPPPPTPEKIEVVEDEKEIEETVIESTETDETEAVEVEEIEEVEEVEEVVEDVSFMIIEDVPVFPGCKGNKAKLKKCFSQKVQKHFSRKFDADLPNELGLSSGRKRVFIGFKIDKNGNIVNVNARAPHPKIKSEVIKVMKQLPKMKPGRQRGKPVGVKYSIPFTLIVE